MPDYDRQHSGRSAPFQTGSKPGPGTEEKTGATSLQSFGKPQGTPHEPGRPKKTGHPHPSGQPDKRQPEPARTSPSSRREKSDSPDREKAGTPYKGKLIVIVAPSGAGKTSLARRLVKEFPNIAFSVSATTRPPRRHEVHGADYYFLSDEEFTRRVKAGDFLEWEEFYNGIRYGTLHSEVEKQLKNGYFTLLDVEVNGALNVKKIYADDCLSVFIKPPSLEILETRLKKRGTETEESLKLRLERARLELDMGGHFDEVIINDDFEVAYRQLKLTVQQYIHQFSKG